MRRVLERWVWVGAGLLALAAGCGQSDSLVPSAQAGAGGSGSGSGGTALGGTGGQALPPPLSSVDVCPGGAPRSPLTRWSVLDLDRTLDEWFEPGPSLASEGKLRDNGYTRDLSPSFVRALRSVAEARAQAAVPDAPPICDVDAAEEPSCLRAWLHDWSLKLYRRPAATAQIDAYVTQFRAQEQLTSRAMAARNVLVSMLLSPYFVLRLEQGEADSPSQLDPYEIAARLSHFAARRAPDVALMERATAGELSSPERRVAELRRLWSEPDARRARALTHLEWLGISSTPWRDDMSAELQADMMTQARMLVEEVLQSSAPTLQSLLTWRQQAMNARLAAHVRLDWTEGAEFQVVTVDEGLAAGVLATGAFLARFPRPTLRGRQISHALLDVDVPEPVERLMVPLAEGPTPRARIEATTGHNSVCMGCHDLMDPVGFALEAFDDQGRTTGLDSSGALPSLSEAPMVANPHELGTAIGLSSAGYAAAARRYLEFALDRELQLTNTTTALALPNPNPGAPLPPPILGTPDQIWLTCLASQYGPVGFNFTLVAEAIVQSSLMTTRTDYSRRVVAFDTNIDPVEHALRETSQFLGIFSNPADDAVVRGYQHALEQELRPLDLDLGLAGAGGEAAGGVGGAAEPR